MRSNISSTGRGKKILPAILIAANVIMLVVGIFTIPPNLRAEAEKESSVPRAEQTSPVTPSPEDEAPPASAESGGVPSSEETGVSLSTEERPDLRTFSGTRRTWLTTEFPPTQISLIASAR